MKPALKKLFKYPILIGLFLFLSMLILLNFFRGTSAVAPKINVLMSPTTLQMNANEEKDVTVIIQAENTADKISGMDVIFRAAGGVEFVSATTPIDLTTGATDIFDQLVHDIKPATIRLAYVSLKPNEQLPRSVRVTLRVKATSALASAGSITYDPASSVTGTIAENTFDLGTASQVAVTKSDSTQTTATPSPVQNVPGMVNMMFNPGVLTVPPNQDGTVTLIIKSSVSTEKISGFDIELASSFVYFVGIGNPFDPTNSTTQFSQIIKTVGDNVVKLSYVIPAADASLPNEIHVPIAIRGTSIGTGTITVNTTKSTIVGNIASKSYQFGTVSTAQINVTTGSGITPTVTIPGGPTPTNIPPIINPSPFPTSNLTTTPVPNPPLTITAGSPPNQPVPTIGPENVNIKMYLRFQGIVTATTKGQPAIPVSVGIVSNSNPSEFFIKNVQFKYAGRGVFEGDLQYKVIPGPGYKVYVKAEKHLQRKICDAQPSDQLPHLYECANNNGNITLVKGNNTLNFAQIIQFAGDVPFKGENNGVIDAFDIIYIKTHFGKATETLADLNYDGFVDSQDHTLAISGMQLQKYDQY